MDLKQVFAGTALVVACFFAFTFWFTDLNANYGSTVGTSFQDSMTVINETYGTLGSVATTSAGNTETPSGAGEEDQDASLITRSLSTIRQVGSFFGLVPVLIEEAAEIVGVPAVFIFIAKWVFLFSLAITIVFILLQVVRRT